MPILGHGDIASILNDRPGALFFASGVSNSSCEDDSEFERETELLLRQDKNLFLFYFGTISMYEKSSAYVRHKIRMELWVRSIWTDYCIIRLGNLDWGTNQNTFLNYIRNRKAKNLPFEIRDEWKYMVSKDQLLLITDNIPLEGRHEINIFGNMAKVKDLI